MSWYSASLVYVIRLKSAGQTDFPVWENTCLIEAEDDNEAFQKAEVIGREREVDDPALTLDGEPAVMSFHGVKKIFEIYPSFDVVEFVRPDHGTEVGFSRYSVSAMEDLEKLMSGACVQVSFEG